MNQANMAGMNPGNPAMRAMPGMNHGVNGVQTGRPQEQDENAIFTAKLHHYMYAYFIEKQMWDCARSLKNSTTEFHPPLTADNADVNGADEKIDIKDGISKKPADLPNALKNDSPTPFLLEWFQIFWDIYLAQKKGPEASAMANNFVQLSQAQARRTNQQQQMQLQGLPGGMMPGGVDYQNQMMRGGNQMLGMGMANGGDLRQRALQNNRMQPGNPQQQQQLAQMMRAQQQQQQAQQVQQQQQMLQNQMRRDGSEINGQRPRTPSGADHASPSKRQRLEGVNFNGQAMMQNGRAIPPGAPGQAMMQDPQANVAGGQLLMNNGIDPANLSASQFAIFSSQPPAVQQKSIQIYAQNISNQRDDLSKLARLSDQCSPMTGSAMDLGNPEFFAGNPAAAMQMRGNMPQGANGGGPQGNHALQDYQMQLMLLEQQNKKRLLMARQEQDTIGRPESQPGTFPAGMSPSGSRGGPSPQPDQIRRGTPKIGQPGVPGSPMPDGRMTGSPAPMGFSNMDPQIYNQMNGGRMQPPPGGNQFNAQFNGAQLELMQRGQAGGNRVPNGSWPQGQPGQPGMAPQQPQQPPQPASMGTPQQRNEMPPPSGVPANAANGRTSSPNPPTPQPASKANPKTKKDAKDRKASKTTKKGGAASVAATPASDAENPPATPTASTPITPSHPTPFPKTEPQNPANAVQNSNGVQPTAVIPPQPEGDTNSQIQNMDAQDQTNDFGMAFAPEMNENLLEGFDFDQFIQLDTGWSTDALDDAVIDAQF